MVNGKGLSIVRNASQSVNQRDLHNGTFACPLDMTSPPRNIIIINEEMRAHQVHLRPFQ